MVALTKIRRWVAEEAKTLGVAMPKVEVMPSQDSFLGSYSYADDVLAVAVERPESELRETIKHELGHKKLHSHGARVADIKKWDDMVEAAFREIEAEECVWGKLLAADLAIIASGLEVTYPKRTPRAHIAAVAAAAKEAGVKPSTIRRMREMLKLRRGDRG